MNEAVYLMCAITSVFCAILLYRTYRIRPSQLLLWSSICFAGLCLNNILLFVDLVLTGPTYDLSMVRLSLAFVSSAVLVFGLIWDVV